MKTASLLALALGLACVMPTFAHADYRPHQPVRAPAAAVAFDRNHDGHIGGREVRRVNTALRLRQREMERREAARVRYARAHAERRAFWDAVRYPYRYR